MIRYPGGYTDSHNEPSQAEYSPEEDVTVQITAGSETGIPYLAYVKIYRDPSDGWINNAELLQMEPTVQGRGEVPDIPSREWVRAHWTDIESAAKQF